MFFQKNQFFSMFNIEVEFLRVSIFVLQMFGNRPKHFFVIERFDSDVSTFQYTQNTLGNKTNILQVIRKPKHLSEAAKNEILKSILL